MDQYSNAEKTKTNDATAIVVAIDFGTSHSCYAYSYSYEKDKIYVNKKWNCGLNMLQVPTAVLFDGNQNFVAFGEEAEEMYIELTDSECEQEYYFFHRFKMMLQSNKHLGKNTTLKAANGKEMNAIDVFAEAIKFLKDHFLQHLNHKSNTKKIDIQNIRWVLTVPAIWSDAAKQFMREAAIKVGIISENLLIVLEPECAAMHILTLPDKDLNLSLGSRYILLDCGGGTIDISCHEIIGKHQVKEIQKASGGPWGSIEVDKLFELFLEKVFTEEVIREFQNNFPAEWLEFKKDFEKLKRAIKPDSRHPLIPIPSGLPCVFNDLRKVELSTYLKSRDYGVQVIDSYFQINYEVLRDFIELVATDISNHLSELLSVQPHTVIMVGGFTNSSILTNFIKKNLQNIKVFIPENQDIAVVKGAVLFGWNNNVVCCRRSKKSYGLKTTPRFDPDRYDPNRKIVVDEIDRCKNVFDVLIEANDPVDNDMIIRRTYKPSSKNDIATTLELFASDKTDVKYTDEDDTEKIGRVRIRMPDTTYGRQRKVEIEIYFGLTEIQLVAVHDNTREELKCDFFSYDGYR